LLCWIVVLPGIAGVVQAQDDRDTPAREAAQNPFQGKAIAIFFKGNASEIQFMEAPQIRTFGKQTFLLGRVPREQRRHWVPLADVSRIEEFTDVEELGKYYRPGPASKKPSR
jgi:hypothetical protein